MQACCRECTCCEQVIPMVINMKGNKQPINVSIGQVITGYRYECRPRYMVQIVVSCGSVHVLLLCIWGYSPFVFLTIVGVCSVVGGWECLWVCVCVQSMSVSVVQMPGGRVQECDSCEEEAVLVPGGLRPLSIGSLTFADNCIGPIKPNLQIGSLPSVKWLWWESVHCSISGDAVFASGRHVPKELSRKAKVSIYHVPTFTWGHELWVVTERTRWRLQAANINFLHRVSGLS